jgi:type IV pilus assembly protein PilB
MGFSFLMEVQMKLGEILVEAGFLTHEKLQQALIAKNTNNLKLGQYLVREGIVDEAEIVDLLSRQLKIKKYRPGGYDIDKFLTEVLPAEMAHRFQVAPLKMNDHLIEIAMIDPLDIEAVDEIESYTNMEIETVICTEWELNHLHRSLYRSFSGVDDALKGFRELEIDKDAKEPNSTEDIEVTSLQGMAEEAPIVVLVNSILFQAIQESASDVHICPQKNRIRLRLRVDGELRDIPAPPKHLFLPIVSRLKILAGMDIAVSRIPQDGRFSAKMKNVDINIRAATIPSIYGEIIVLRILNTGNGVLSLEQLGMSEQDREKIEGTIIRPHGMILSTGPTGSGKSTCLYSILKEINQPNINIITIEDPVEYRIDEISQIQINRKAGMSFASGLRSILRQDPDVILVGEIRDSETAKIAIQAGLTGHKVLSTLHTNDAAGAITRMLDMGIEPFLVSSVVILSIAQRLVRKVCPNCKVNYKPSEQVAKYWGLNPEDDKVFVQGRGCQHCMNTGYRGRTGIYETLIIGDEIKSMVLENKSAHEIERAAIKSGNFTTLKENAIKKALQGVTTLEEAASVVML